MTATSCPACTMAESDPGTPHRTAGCLDCEARSIAGASLDWQAPKHAPGRTRWHVVRDLMAVIWRDEQRREEGRRLVWRWVLRLKRASVGGAQ